MATDEVDFWLLVVSLVFGVSSLWLGVTGIATLSMRSAVLSLLLAVWAVGILLAVAVT